MGYGFTVGDVEFLGSAGGAAALAAAAELPLTAASRLADVASVRGLVGAERAAAVLETAVLRRRAAGRIAAAAGWLFTDEAVQQASASVVAAHRAARLARLGAGAVHDVTCSVGSDLDAFAAAGLDALGSDLDPVRLAMARHNLRVTAARHRGSAAVVRADALSVVSRGAVVYADPARRDTHGRRTWRPSDLAPRLDHLVTVHNGRPLVVKSAPGLDFALVPWAAEVELVSLDGDVREACLWSAELATAGRRATVLSGDGGAWMVTDAEPDDCPVRPPGEWLVNPDGAVVRAGLVRHYGARHGLGMLDERIAYLTGDAPPPGIRAFRVLEHGHYTEKSLRAALHRHHAGAAEILVRGLDVDPNALRTRLKLRGDASLTVVLTRIGRTPTAFLCHAERT
ncbi:MAG TPA: class I SAM-dependent methyltransferase [Pseudonocardiaceae bacterium]